jgi:hypothetical protein
MQQIDAPGGMPARTLENLYLRTRKLRIYSIVHFFEARCDI